MAQKVLARPVALPQVPVARFSDSLSGKIAALADKLFSLASFITEPITKMREKFVELFIADERIYGGMTPPQGWQHTAQKLWFWIKTVSKLLIYTTLGLLLAPAGILLRMAGNKIRPANLSYQKGMAPEKPLPANGAFNMLTWNICGVKGGYNYTDGGVAPLSDRLPKIIEYIDSKDCDIVCANEVFDITDAKAVIAALKNRYAHFCYSMGPKALGLSSGLFFASKYAIDAPEFTPFPQDFLPGRTKGTSKGVFRAALLSYGRTFATIYHTHPPHSESCCAATPEEEASRQKSMELICDKMQREAKPHEIQILTGDLNLDHAEKQKSAWSAGLTEDMRQKETITWVGDHGIVEKLAQKLPACLGSPDKIFSDPLKYDYALLSRNAATATITTEIDAQGIGYQKDMTGQAMSAYTDAALSDHLPLISTIGPQSQAPS